MRAHDDAHAAPEHAFQHIVDAGVEDVALLPRRRNEHHIPTGRVALNGSSGELIFGNLAIEQVVAAFHKIFALGAVELLGTAQLAHLMGARAQHRVVVVVGALLGREMGRRHVVEHEHVLDVLADIGALDVVVLQVLERGYDQIGVHLHHERDDLALSDVIGLQARLGLCQLEHLVIGVVRHVVDVGVGMREQPLDRALEVLVEATSLGIEDDVLTDDLEETLVVGLLALGKRIALVPFLLGAREVLELLKLGAACFEVLVVDVFRRLHQDVRERLDGDGGQVRAHPVEAHARGDEHAQDEGKADRQAVRHVLLRTRLLALQRVDAVLREAHDDGGKPREKRHDPRRAAVLEGNLAQELSPRRAAVGDCMDNVDQAEQDDDLYSKRNQGEHRVVMLLLVELVLLLADRLAVAVVLHFQAIQGGHKLHHDNRVLLAPKRHRDEDDLHDDGEQQDGYPPIAAYRVTGLQDEREQPCKCFHASKSFRIARCERDEVKSRQN